MKMLLTLLMLTLCLLMVCGYSGSKYDPASDTYVPPSFAIDTSDNGIASGDTVTGSSGKIVIRGNDGSHRNQFSYSIDGNEWSKWMGDNEASFMIPLDSLAYGLHTVKVKVCYSPENKDETESTITFFRVQIPQIISTTDTVLNIDALAPCTLWVASQGTAPLKYQWFRGETALDNSVDSFLVVPSVVPGDSLSRWNCNVVNAWGDAKSPSFRVNIRFRVLYDGNGNENGSILQDTLRYSRGSIVKVPGNPGLTRRGYTFGGWNTVADGSGITRDSNDIFLIDTTNVVLYTKWNPNPSFALTYDRNGATGGALPDVSRSYKTDELVLILGNTGTLLKTGFTFTGWNTKTDGSGGNFMPDTLIEMGSVPLVLYAKWEINSYLVTFDSRGGSSVPAQKVNDGAVLIKPPDPAKLGYTFIGWYKDSLLTNAWLFTTKVNSGFMLYAKWIVRDIDGNVYSTVTIGNQVWLAENLRTTRYNDNTAIDPATDSAKWVGQTTGAYCWYKNDAGNKLTYGALYNWHAVSTNRLAPKGWHVPSDAEWDTLINILGGTSQAGGRMKEVGTTHWSSPNTGATNESGFNGLPGGSRSSTAAFASMNAAGYWWSSLESSKTSAYTRDLRSTASVIGRVAALKINGLSVCCILDTKRYMDLIDTIRIKEPFIKTGL